MQKAVHAQQAGGVGCGGTAHEGDELQDGEGEAVAEEREHQRVDAALPVQRQLRDHAVRRVRDLHKEQREEDGGGQPPRRRRGGAVGAGGQERGLDRGARPLPVELHEVPADLLLALTRAKPDSGEG